MGISFLQPFLQSLCYNSPWNYAVFWKLEHQHELILVWEDAFCDILKPSHLVVGPIEDLCLQNTDKILSSILNSSVLNGTPGEYPIGLALAEMSSASYAVGKGVLGKVAFAGNARWIFSDSIATDVSDSLIVSEYPDEWLLEFASGIQTILLLPVIPHGVLQLGSVEMVAEDADLVTCIKDKFEAYQKFDVYDWRYAIQHFTHMPDFMGNVEEPSIIYAEKSNEDERANFYLFADQMVPLFMAQDLGYKSESWVTNSLENVIYSEINQQTVGTSHIAEPCQLSCEDDKSFMIEDSISNSFHLDEQVIPFPCDDSGRIMYGGFRDELMDFHFEENVMEPTLLGSDFDNAFFESGSNFFIFPGDFESHKALGLVAVGNNWQHTYDSSIPVHNLALSTICDRDPSYSMDLSGMGTSEFLMKEIEVEHILESLATNICSTPVDNSSIKSDVTSLNTSSGEPLVSSTRSSKPKEGASEEDDTVPLSLLAPAFTAQGRNSSSDLSASFSPVETMVTALAVKKRQRKEYNCQNSMKLSRLSSTKKRRVLTGNDRRTKPRDRQLIQDRLKELRQLVPNSDKCSIDGLLDKTVKHMLFLRSVTNQADKLRRQVLKEEADDKTVRATEIGHSNEKGASWAVELGSKQQLCPIVVKDLDHPGHMLIEMLCADHGRFLEIADVIHRLQLTILKGVMEKGAEKSWAHFTIETSGSFRRLDIFWPLMQLSQQSRPPTAGKV